MSDLCGNPITFTPEDDRANARIVELERRLNLSESNLNASMRSSTEFMLAAEKAQADSALLGRKLDLCKVQRNLLVLSYGGQKELDMKLISDLDAVIDSLK
jgi:hypothetical protein